MKHKVVTIICLSIAAVLFIIAAVTWNSQQVKVRVEQAKTYAQQEYNEQLRKAAIATEKKRLHDQCIKQQQFYDGQSVAYQKSTPRPKCDLDIVE